MTIVADTSVRHDALFGCSNLRSASDRYGDAGVGGAHPNARDLLTLGVAKHGLSRRDVPPNINLFKGVRVATDGSLHFDGDPAPGAHVELRAELDVVVVVANTPHPVDPRPGYEGSTVRFTAWRDHHPDPDPFRRTSPERLRAFENSDQFLGLGR